MLLADTTNFSLDTGHASTPSSQMLIGNKNIILKDILNRKLSLEYRTSIEKTGKAYDQAKQTYILNS